MNKSHGSLYIHTHQDIVEPAKRSVAMCCHGINTKGLPMRRTLFGLTIVFAYTWSHAPAADDYKLGPDSQEQPNVPKGKVTKSSWTSTIFPGTVRDYWVYVPAQYDPQKPA